MRVRSNPTLLFEHTNCDDIDMTTPSDQVGVIEIKQGEDRVWIPVAEATAFADALKAYSEELAA